MERPIFKPLGTPAEELDTPSLVIELDALEHNLNAVHTFFQQTSTKLRPIVSIHGCPSLAHKQLAAGGTVDGIAVMTLGQAEIFAAYGCRDILLVNTAVATAKLRRLGALARQVDLTVVVDHPMQLERIAEASKAADVTLHVLVHINRHPHQGGVAPGPDAVALAHATTRNPSLNFLGITALSVPTANVDTADVESMSWQQLHQLADTRAALEREGFDVQVMSVGESLIYEEAAKFDGITEVMAGTYALMDAHYAAYWPHLKPAAHVLSTVTSRPEPGLAIADAGQKAVGVDLGLPQVAAFPGIETIGLNAEHCRLRLDESVQTTVQHGHKLWLNPWDLGTCMNLYDIVWVARQGKIEATWPVAARGQYR